MPAPHNAGHRLRVHVIIGISSRDYIFGDVGMIDWLFSSDPGFADTVLILLVSFVAFIGGLMTAFAPMMASRSLTAKEQRSQKFGCVFTLAGFILGLWSIVEIFV